MAKEKKNPNEGASYENKLEAIKDIIFGQEKEDLSRQLEELKSHVEDRQGSMEEELAKLKKELQSKMGELEQAMKKQILEAQAQTNESLGQLDQNKVDRAALGQMLVDMGSALMAEKKD